MRYSAEERPTLPGGDTAQCALYDVHSQTTGMRARYNANHSTCQETLAQKVRPHRTAIIMQCAAINKHDRVKVVGLYKMCSSAQA